MGRSENIKFPETEYMYPGHFACQGCGAPLAMRYVIRILGKRTVVVIPAGCFSVIQSPFPYSTMQMPVVHTAFETAASTASGIRAALDMKGKEDVHVLAWAGDGATFDIGLQALSGAAERNENIIYACYDNEAYMNTGIQRSSATPYGAWTTTTPEKQFKDRPKKNIIEILAGHKIPYAATASVAYPEDLMNKTERARTIKGTRFLHILSPCPPGWKMSIEKTIKVARLATLTKVFPLYEVINGEEYIINMKPKDIPVSEYFKYQQRFRHLTKEEVEDIQARVNYEWECLLNRSMMRGFENR
ncbi:MAG: 2-ketoisovalerate ferredoxin oxidoreductase [Candidatus Schekmanbacteria bacterium RBG_16_38_11]|uniref:2-ketoisovalerate ferredoxin oxidoreductase n=1 Tax=Candidatus Schekmanbacteria bacterium RBG_16_38_11 TaxID=1817880 RepID=A0A1F7RWW6_9BACT|nr:MAG: 2-ketoisovalerate ferredoxin oxidoreductase [Candidatus Schekmanbacteria bacterium RBG_16_38_11]